MRDGEFQTPDQQHEAMTVIGEDVDIKGGMRFDTLVLIKGRELPLDQPFPISLFLTCVPTRDRSHNNRDVKKGN